MLLFVGLGNPGSATPATATISVSWRCKRSRAAMSFSPWRRRFQGVAVEGKIAAERVLLLLPGTYMNESGRAVAEAANFYKLEPGHIVVFHDEVELPPAKVRVKIGGGNAGHNGLRSISEHIGNDYQSRALRHRPPGRQGAGANLRVTGFRQRRAGLGSRHCARSLPTMSRC